MKDHNGGVSKKKKKSVQTAVDKAFGGEMDEQQGSLVDDKLKKPERHTDGAARKMTRLETDMYNDEDAKDSTNQAHMDLLEPDTKDQPFQKDLNNVKRRKHRKRNSVAFTNNLDSSGEVKAEDDLASDKKSSDTMIVVCSEENEGKQDLLDGTDAKKKKRTRRRKRKLPTRNDTSQNPIQDDPGLSDQEGFS